MMRSLPARSTLNTAVFLAVLALVLFASAGTLRFWHAWLYLGLQAASMTATNVYLYLKDPALLERRLLLDEQGEKERGQRILIRLVRALAFVMLVVAGLDHRFGWSSVPAAVVAAGGVAFLAGAAVVVAVFRENTFTSSIIEVAEGQRVVATGPYRVLRHPMYAGFLLMSVATPLVLGSIWAELIQPVGIALVVLRLLAEERMLSERLPGYREYMSRTRRRLVPAVW